MRSASSAPCASLSRAYGQTANGGSIRCLPNALGGTHTAPASLSFTIAPGGKTLACLFSREGAARGGGVAVAVAGDIVVAKALQMRAAPDTQAIKTGKGVEGNAALRPCALHKSWGAHVSDGSWLCKNAKTLNRDRRSCSSKTALVVQLASEFNLEVELKNIILVAFRFFEFLHSQGQSRRF